MSGTRLALFAVLLSTAALGPAAGGRKEPPPPLPAVVQALRPTGLRISVLDEEGIDLVTINANINVPLEEKERGQIAQTINRAQDGFWTLEDTSQELKHKDAVFYWVYISSKQGRRYTVGHHIISELVDPVCKPSVTTVNGKPACKGALILEDNFETLNTTTWKHNVEFWEKLFSSFVPDEENSFADDGVLHIKPTAITDESQLIEATKLEGCTSKWDDNCQRNPFAWQILPPTRTAWLSSTSSFRFGRFEMRAKPATGDWLYSGIYLYPLGSEYGGSLNSGEIVVMRGRGNADLRSGDDDNLGANQMHAQIGIEACDHSSYYYGERVLPEGLFTDVFHTYAVTWTPREIHFELDGKVFKRIEPPLPDGFLGTDEFDNCENSSWEKGHFLAPFDKEFTVDLSLNVGGFFMFPDGSKSGENVKPWRDHTPRAALDFWRARDAWLPTWKGDLEIDYVKVWAL